MKRLFIAVKIEAGTEFLRVLDTLKKKLSGESISWVRPDHLHITLKFFGDTPEVKIPGILEAMRNCVSATPPFEIKVCKTGIFGSRYQPKVIWFGLENDEPLRLLQTKLTEELKTIGFFPDRQNFVPHLTLARIRNLRDKPSFQTAIDEFKDAEFQTSRIDEMVLYASTLTTQGAIYQILERQPLQS